MIESLWGSEFNVKEEDVQAILAKAKNKKEIKTVSVDKLLKSKSVSIEEKIEVISQNVHNVLGKYENRIATIRDVESYNKYIDKAIVNGIIAIDTETDNTLDTIEGKLMGLCLYTPGEKAVYIPVNHINMYTEKLVANQLTCEEIAVGLQKLVDNKVKIIYHNASFDIEVLYSNTGILLPVYWDTLVGAKLLNENELAGLKAQYRLHIDPEQEKYDIEHLFNGMKYKIFDSELFKYYAATDSLITYDLYLYQIKEFEKKENKGIYNLLKTIEIPIIPVIVGMELRGIEVDTEYAKKMSVEYHKKLDEIQGRIDQELERLKPWIDEWKLTSAANLKPMNKSGTGYGKSKIEQLSNPIELGSPTQMAILLYDILEVPVVDKKKPRTTDAAALKILAEEKHVKICELLLEKREVDILINSFIDKIPTLVKKDGRVHARFNPMGTVTGRFSSESPNLQQIPSHDKAIRLIFKATDGYSIVGADYSGQEMRVLASAAEDKEMISAYENKQDIYAKVASLVYRNDYEDNLEFRPSTGELQPDGKRRRANAKTVALGLNYGMSVHSLAERLNESEEEAQKVIDGYYGGLAGVKRYTELSQKMLREKGYVTDLWGRQRRIPDALLPDFSITPNKKSDNFNPLLGSIEHEDKAQQLKIKQYQDKLAKAKYKKDIDNIISQAQREGFSIRNNKGFISRSLRQCLNARIQGSSASMTKLAMIMIDNDKILNDLGFKLLITVHDEVLGQCPRENSEAAAKRLSEVMVAAAQDKCNNVPWKCDGYAVSRWYLDEFSGEVRNEYHKMKDDPNVIGKLKAKYPMINPEFIEQMCNETFDINKDSNI